MNSEVWNNAKKNRFEIWVDGEHAGLIDYTREDDVYAMPHTEVFDDYGGRGVGTRLVVDALHKVRDEQAEVLPYCPFIQGVMSENPELAALVPETERVRFGLKPA